MEIQRDRKQRVLRPAQIQYIEKILSRFRMEKAKPMTTPLGSQFQLSRYFALRRMKTKGIWLIFLTLVQLEALRMLWYAHGPI